MSIAERRGPITCVTDCSDLTPKERIEAKDIQLHRRRIVNRCAMLPAERETRLRPGQKKPAPEGAGFS
jgi:hypothetical protein